jgi:hypothetical protein
MFSQFPPPPHLSSRSRRNLKKHYKVTFKVQAVLYELGNKNKAQSKLQDHMDPSALLFLLDGLVLGQRNKLHNVLDDRGFDPEPRGDVVHTHRTLVVSGLSLVQLDYLLDVLDVQGT